MDYGKTNRDVWEKDADGALCGEETCGCESMESTSPHEMSPRGEGDEKSGGCQGEDRGDAGSPYAWYADEWVEPVVFRTEQQVEVSCPFPAGTPPEPRTQKEGKTLIRMVWLILHIYMRTVTNPRTMIIIQLKT